MTKVMKFEVVAYYILKVLGYLCGIIGALRVFGCVGSLDCGTMTVGQFVIQELIALGLISLSFVFYVVRNMVEEDFDDRARCLRLRARYCRYN